MWWATKWLILWSLWAARLVRQPTPPVRVSNGWLRGSVAHSGTHKYYLGIPYATLQGRFQAPGPEPTWDGVMEAIVGNIHCTQATTTRANTTSGTEHCLTLNVFTALNTPEEPLPVIVFIHGGAYIQRSGSPLVYGPEYLTPKGVVLVTLNYRLNIQGFLCLGIKGAPGNAGLKDQVAALKWVQRNIKTFGGDPDNVTIMGQSAGAMSVSLHVVSAMSKGLFHKAIIQSGSSLSGFTIQQNPIETASLHAKRMGFNTQAPHELYNFFMKQSDTDLIINRIPREEGTIVMTDIPYVPCIEQIVEGEEAFLTDHPYNLLEKGDYNKVPIIIGANIEEGLYLITMDLDDFIVKATYDTGLPKNLVFPSNKIRKTVAEGAKTLYGGDDDISKHKVKFSKLYGEPYLTYQVLEETELLLKTSDQPIYHYLFCYDSLRNLPKILALNKNLMIAPYGATHADELFYLFSQPLTPSFFEYKIINQMSVMWTNFAKYGDPTPSGFDLRWPAVTPNDKRLLVIDSELKTAPLWHSESVLFWRDVYSKYRRK